MLEKVKGSQGQFTVTWTLGIFKKIVNLILVFYNSVMFYLKCFKVQLSPVFFPFLAATATATGCQIWQDPKNQDCNR